MFAGKIEIEPLIGRDNTMLETSYQDYTTPSTNYVRRLVVGKDSHVNVLECKDSPGNYFVYDYRTKCFTVVRPEVLRGLYDEGRIKILGAGLK